MLEEFIKPQPYDFLNEPIVKSKREVYRNRISPAIAQAANSFQSSRN